MEKCRKCKCRMTRNVYWHCEDCGHEPQAALGRRRYKKCGKCRGRIIREEYYSCPRCGLTK